MTNKTNPQGAVATHQNLLNDVRGDFNDLLNDVINFANEEQFLDSTLEKSTKTIQRLDAFLAAVDFDEFSKALEDVSWGYPYSDKSKRKCDDVLKLLKAATTENEGA